MKQVTINLYEFSELSDKAKQRAREWYIRDFEYPWAHEAIESVKRLAGRFNARLVDYEISWDGSMPSSCSFRIHEELDKQEIENVLAGLQNHDELTGYFTDYPVIEGF